MRMGKSRNVLWCAVVVLALAVGAAVVYTRGLALAAPHVELVGGVRVSGSRAFCNRTVAAMELLRTGAPADFATVCSVVALIEEADRSAAMVESGTVCIAAPTSGASPAWYASVLAHEAHHVTLYRTEGRHRVGNAVFEAEVECNRLQADVLRRVGGTAYELQWLASQSTGRHPDVNGDGTYDWDDYRARKW